MQQNKRTQISLSGKLAIPKIRRAHKNAELQTAENLVSFFGFLLLLLDAFAMALNKANLSKKTRTITVGRNGHVRSERAQANRTNASERNDTLTV